MEKLLVLILLLIVQSQNLSARSLPYQAKPDTSGLLLSTTDDTSYLKLREKARSRIKSAGWSVGAGFAVFGAGLGLKDLQRKRAQPDIVGQKGRNALGDVLLAIGGILLIGAVVLFISWIFMKKGAKKNNGISFSLPPTVPGAQFRNGFSLNIGLGK